MNYIAIIIITMLLLSFTNALGQNKLLLESKKNHSKIIYLELDRNFDIETIDTVYSYKSIVGFTETTISIPTLTKTQRDSTYFVTSKDTTYSYTEPIYKKDTIVFSISDIQTLRTFWLKDRAFLEGFGWAGLGIPMGVLLLPVAAIKNGLDGVKEWAEFEAILIAVIIPPIYIGTRKIEYDLKNEWSLKSQ